MTDASFYNQQRIYDQTWEDGIKAGKEQRGNQAVNIQFLEKTGLIESGLRILEVGCGIGSVADHLHRAGCKVTGTDISNSAIEHGQKKYPGLDLKVGAAESLDFPDASFDMVMSFDVLEHLADVDSHLAEVARVLTGGGCYLLQTPNKYFNIVYETLRSRSMKWKKYHPSLHTPGGLKRRFRKKGFDVKFVKMNTFNEYSLNKLKYKWLKSIAAKIDFTRMPLSLQTNLYVQAFKRT